MTQEIWVLSSLTEKLRGLVHSISFLVNILCFFIFAGRFLCKGEEMIKRMAYYWDCPLVGEGH